MRKTFFCDAWNSLPVDIADFNSFSSFRRTVTGILVDFSKYFECSVIQTYFRVIVSAFLMPGCLALRVVILVDLYVCKS